MTIFDMEDNSKIVVGEVDHKSRLYTFSKFIAKSDSTLLLTHANDDIKIWHEIFFHLNFRYMQQLNKQGMVEGLLDIQFLMEFVKDVFLESIHKINLRKGRHGGPPLPWILFTVTSWGLSLILP
jgi:hypothetical protein